MNKIPRWRFALLMLLVVLIVTGFTPAGQGIQRFVTILTQNITVSKTAQFDGPADFNSTVDFSGSTVSGLGSYFTTDDTGNVTITGTLSVSDTAVFSSAVTANDWVKVTIPTAIATATPAFVVDNSGAGNNILSLRKLSTPVFVVGNSGRLTGQDATFGGNAVVNVPTAAATATPGLVVDNNGAGNNILSLRKLATPVFVVSNAGGLTAQGASFGGNAVVNAPTAVATATPALLVNSDGAGNNLLSVRKASTPVFVVGNSGTVTGYVLSSDVSGRKCVQGTQQITGTGTIAHGLSTPVAVQLTLAEDVTGDGALLSYTNASATVTAKVWTNEATPAAASSPHTVDYTICGTP